MGTIGEGAFGKVYKVKDKTTNELFAIKETPFLGEKEYDRVMKEVANGSALNHVNVVRFNEYFVDRKANKLFITLELCDFNLSEWFRRNMENRIYNEAIHMFREIACGIQYIHDQNIIHRDLKPANILIKSHVCKIADFGFAKRDAGMTSVVGTPMYASPEQVNGMWCEKSTDIFPLGLIFFEFFMKFNNFFEYLAIMAMILHDKRMLDEKFFERYRHSNPGKFEEAEQLLFQMMEFVPSNRPTIQEVFNQSFYLTNTNKSTGNSMTHQTNCKASDDNDHLKDVELRKLLRLITENNGTTKKRGTKSVSNASNKTAVKAETGDSDDCSDEDDFTAMSSVSQRNALLTRVCLQRTDVQTLLNAAIPRWNVKTERSINYNSFKPFQQILLSDQSPLESKYWAIWELANLTYVNASIYCPYLEVNNLLELIDIISKNIECPTNMRLLALTVMQHYETYKSNN